MIASAAIYYLFNLFIEKEIDFLSLSTNLGDSWYLITLVLILMPVNWALELIKWRGLVIQVEEISIKKSVNSILAGILLSLLTPNRVGELGGKLIYIQKEKRSAVLYFNSVCSISQLLITIIVGLAAMFFLRDVFAIWVELEDELFLGLIFLIYVLIVSIFFKSNSLVKIFNYFSKARTKESISINTSQRISLILLSLARYLVFCIQFFILVKIFESEITIFESTLSIALIFFLTAIVPTGWISDLPVRTTIAFFVFESMSFSGSSGLSASILLWIINLLIPALLSLALLRDIDWMKNLIWSRK